MTRHRLLRPLAAAAAVAAVCAGAAPGALAGYQPKDADAARHLRLEHQATVLLNEALRHVQATQAGCRPPRPGGPGGVTHDAPSAAVLDVLAPLRRPAAPGDTPTGPMPPFGGTTYADYVRTVTAPGGVRMTIVVQRGSAFLDWHPSTRCLDAEHARLLRVAAHAPRAVRSTALELFGRLRRATERAAARAPKPGGPPADHIYLFSDGGGGGGADAATFREHGLLGTRGWGPGTTRPSRVDGLVPDGVGSVTLEYPKVVGRGPYYKPTVYPSAVTVTAAVQDNVFTAQVARPAGDAFPHRMVWRDAAGAVLRTVGR